MCLLKAKHLTFLICRRHGRVGRGPSLDDLLNAEPQGRGMGAAQASSPGTPKPPLSILSSSGIARETRQRSRQTKTQISMVAPSRRRVSWGCKYNPNPERWLMQLGSREGTAEHTQDQSVRVLFPFFQKGWR